MSDSLYVIVVSLALAAVSVINRSFFFLAEREIPLPAALKRGLRHAPLAALLAVIAPELALSHGELVSTLREPRLCAAVVAAGYALWRREMLGTIVIGMAVFWGLRFGLGW